MDKSGGVAERYYEPENLDELSDLVKKLNMEGESFDLVGNTSNIYFKNSYNSQNLISTKLLNKWIDNGDTIVCECGVNVMKLSRNMIELGAVGFEGLIDLPGTIGGAVYGNAGCFKCSISSLLKSVKLLKPDGQIVELSYSELSFSKRSSALKRKEIRGVILSVTLMKKLSDNIEKLKALAERNHQQRKQMQPSPAHNLGTTYCQFGKRTLLGEGIRQLGRLYYHLMRVVGYDANTCNRLVWKFELLMVGGRAVVPYLHSLGRFIWKDEKADDVFKKYQKVLNRLYKNPSLEIEIKE